MKTWKFLGAPLMLMLLTGMSWCCVSATDEITEPVIVESGENVSVGNVTVEGGSKAVSVYADGEEDASAKVNGNVSLDTYGNVTAVDTYAYKGDTTTNISGDVSCQTHGLDSPEEYARGISARGSDTNQATVTVDGSVSATNPDGRAIGIEADDRTVVKILKDVSANGAYYAGGIGSRYGATVDVGGNVLSESEHGDAIGLTSSDEGYKRRTTNTIAGDLTAIGTGATGAILTSDSDPEANLSLTVGGNITATSTRTDGEDGSALGIGITNASGKIVADVAGDVIAKSPIANAVGIQFGLFVPEFSDNDHQKNNEIRVHGNIISDGIGIYKNDFNDHGIVNQNNNILVENEIQAKGVGILTEKIPQPFEEEYYGDAISKDKLNLTVWKIKLNENGNAAEYNIDTYYFVDGVAPEGAVTHGQDTEFEKKIMYIIKVEQPGAGGTIKATDANGNDLAKSFDFDVAHEGEKVMLKANLEDGYKLIAAYNGDGERVPLLKDENGNYYIIVPKGGGVYLSVELEDTTEHYQADNGDDIESITDNPEEETATEESNDTKSVSLSSAASKSGSEKLKTGDVSQVAPWLILSVVSTAGIAGLEISKKKDKSEK